MCEYVSCQQQQQQQHRKNKNLHTFILNRCACATTTIFMCFTRSPISTRSISSNGRYTQSQKRMVSNTGATERGTNNSLERQSDRRCVPTRRGCAVRTWDRCTARGDWRVAPTGAFRRRCDADRAQWTLLSCRDRRCAPTSWGRRGTRTCPLSASSASSSSSASTPTSDQTPCCTCQSPVDTITHPSWLIFIIIYRQLIEFLYQLYKYVTLT